MKIRKYQINRKVFKKASCFFFVCFFFFGIFLFFNSIITCFLFYFSHFKLSLKFYYFLFVLSCFCFYLDLFLGFCICCCYCCCFWVRESAWGARGRKERNAWKDAIVFSIFHAQILSVKIVIGQNYAWCPTVTSWSILRFQAT